MKTTSFALAIAVAAALTAPAARDVQAAYSGIQKCRASDGTVLYTDKPCADFGAAPAPASTELELRLANERTQMALAGVDPGVEIMPAGASLADAAGTPTGRRSLAAGCARSATQLAMDVQASIALRDVNRLAESFHWVGKTHAQALPLLQRLERLTHARVVASRVYGGVGTGLQFADATGEAVETGAGTLLLTLQADGRTQPLELNVEQYAGCYFARF
jgi:hypothetical protein